MKIKIYPRIAINLIAMHDGIYRKNGGIGFSIKKPSIILTIEKSKKFIIKDKRDVFLKNDEKNRLLDALKSEFEKHLLNYKIKIKIEGKLPTHSGFGSSTAVRLGSLEALYIINNHRYNQKDIISASKRGGTSGIGIIVILMVDIYLILEKKLMELFINHQV